MAIRGLRTLHTRLAQHGAAALQVAKWLEAQPEVHSVMCPALPSAPGHAIWKRDFTGICGLIGAVLYPAPEPDVAALVDHAKPFRLGFSRGGFESLALPVAPPPTARPHTPK